MLVIVDQPLEVSTSMSIAILLKGSWRLDNMLRPKRKNVFAKILSGATIWDSGKKEVELMLSIAWYAKEFYKGTVLNGNQWNKVFKSRRLLQSCPWKWMTSTTNSLHCLTQLIRSHGCLLVDAISANLLSKKHHLAYLVTEWKENQSKHSPVLL